MKRALVLSLILCAAALFSGEAPRAVPAAAHTPAFDHIFVIVEENQDVQQVVGNPQAPFINDVLIKGNFWQTNFFALNHGSLPDYLGLVSGSEQQQVIGDPPSDCIPDWAKTAPTCAVTSSWPSNIADAIEGSGRTWRAYLQSMGPPCRWQSNDARYDVTHNPFVYFKTVEGGGPVSSGRCEQGDVDLFDAHHSLASDLRAESTTPSFLFVVPDNAHNMHDGNVAGADQFLMDLFTGSNASGANGVSPVNIFASPAWTAGRSIAYVLWDEDSGTFWNQVVAIAVGPWVNGPGGRDGAHFTHYSMLRTWEDAWSLPPIGPGDRAAAPMRGAFNLLGAGPVTGGSGTLAAGHPEVYARVEVNVRSRGAPATLLSLGASSGTEFRLFVNQSGRLAFENRAVDPPLMRSSGVSMGPGWHTVELHIWVRGSTGTCEVFYDGHPLADLSWPQRCPTGAELIHSYLVGDAGGGRQDAAQFKDPALATSAF